MGKGILRQYGTASIIVAGPALSLPHDISSAVGGIATKEPAARVYAAGSRAHLGEVPTLVRREFSTHGYTSRITK
jgi:hypothetical protein